MKRLVHFGNKNDLAPGQILRHPENDEVILVCSAAGKYSAVSRVCTHQSWPLDEAYVLDACIVCPLHGSEFDLETGRCVNSPTTEALKTYSIVEIDNDLYVELNKDEERPGN